jgi:hypothetical protein
MATYTGMADYTSAAPALAGGYGTSALGTAAGLTNDAARGLSMFNPFASNNIGADIAGGQAYAAGQDIPGQVRAAMLPGVQTARDVTLPGMASSEAASGNTNNTRGVNAAGGGGIASGLVQRGLAEQGTGLAAELQGQYTNTGANLAANANWQNNQALLSGYLGGGNLGNTTAGTGLGALNQSIGNTGQMYGIQAQGGSGLQTGQQQLLQNLLQGYNFGQNSPFTAPQNFWNMIGSGNWGQTSNTQGTATMTPSLLNQIGGMVAAGGSLLGSKPGAFGGGSGLLGFA